MVSGGKSHSGFSHATQNGWTPDPSGFTRPNKGVLWQNLIMTIDSRPPGAARCAAIDTLKGAAITSVILLHALPSQWLVGSLAWFHIWQAVPVFTVLLGVTGYGTRVSPLRRYYLRRARRLLPAFAVTWLVSLAAGLHSGTLTWDWWVLVGKLPTGAPGNYFVTLLFEFVLVLPLVLAAWRKSPLGTVLASFALSLTYELVAHTLGAAGYGYSSSVLRYIFAVALGFWVADGRSVLPALPVSALYLIAYARGWVVPFFEEAWQPQNLIAFVYPASIVEVTMKRAKDGIPALMRLGRASYHIFLVQMIWFAFGLPSLNTIVDMPTLMSTAISLTVCCAIGLLFHAADSRFLSA